jgi:predicted XRE-type DNA-binding protein
MTGKLKYVRGSENIFVDLGFDKAEAENLKLRFELLMKIDDFYRRSGMTQAAAAKALGLTQPRLNALLKGKIGQFSLDALVNIASRAGMNVRLVVKKAA